MMYEILNFNSNKVYKIKNFNSQPNDKKYYYNKFVQEYYDFLKEPCFTGHNFKLKDNEFTQFLYFKFFYTSFLLFNFAALQQNNSTNVWAYLNNKNNFSTVIHNHQRTSVINGVYYFNVPDQIHSTLKIYNENRMELGEIKNETDNLLIFSCDLNHMPLQSFTEEYRIALNMEIMCNQEVIKFFKD